MVKSVNDSINMNKKIIKEKNNLINFNNNYLLHPFGLCNNNIICYFNSLLQALFSCSSINEYLLNNETKFNNNNFMKLYIHIIKKYITKNSNDIETLNMTLFNEFLCLLKKKNIQFGYDQEDSGELLVLLLDIINDNYIYNLFYHKYQCLLYCKKCKNRKNIKNDISIQFELDINAINNKYIKFKLDEKFANINKYIRNNYSILDDLQCTECNTYNIIKINQLSLIPTIVVIILNKYEIKINYNFPLELYFINSNQNIKYNYKLVSNIQHSGTCNFGHYISKSIRKVNDNLDLDIFKLNDSYYELSNFKPNNDSYILFYHYIDSTEYYSD